MQLFRFEKPDHLRSMIQSGLVVLSHPSQWPDPYEYSFLSSSVTREHVVVWDEERNVWSSALDRLPASRTSHLTVSNKLGRLVFAQCFSTRAESERMWIAARPENRVRWSIDAAAYESALRASSNGTFISTREVTYLSQLQVDEIHRQYVERYSGLVTGRGMLEWRDAVVSAFCAKREEFSDEHEYRVIAIEPHNGPLAETERARTELKIPLVDLVRDVSLHP